MEHCWKTLTTSNRARSEQDILYEVLLKLGLDLCVPMETRTITGKSVHSVGAGTLIACLDEKITREEVEPLALGIAEWHDELAPAGDSTVVFRDSAFADDVAKTQSCRHPATTRPHQRAEFVGTGEVGGRSLRQPKGEWLVRRDGASVTPNARVMRHDST